MKKLSILLVLVMALAFTFTSCKREKCWKVTVEMEYYDDYSGETYSDKAKFYTWGTEDDLEVAIGDFEDEYGDYYDMDITYEKADKSESDCDDVDLDDFADGEL